LLRAKDPVKDQTYFLSHLSQEQMRRVVFPIGHLTKPEVRATAAAMALPNRARPDSQGICFLGKIPYNEFVRFHLGEKKGSIVEQKTGRILGPHKGTWFHTIGQRKGLGLSGGPWFVSGKDLERNLIFVVHTSEADEVAGREFLISGLNWIAGAPSGQGLSVKIRHGEKRVPAVAESVAEGCLRIAMAEPDRGIAPGQYAVLYEGERCLGGGIITQAL
jgi:tRNA-specific 2-thiouridylase